MATSSSTTARGARSRTASAGGPPPSGDQRPQRVPRDQEAALDEVLVAFEAAVLVLDRDGVVVADRVQRGDEPRPVDLAEARHARHLPADAARERAVAVEAVAAHL